MVRKDEISRKERRSTIVVLNPEDRDAREQRWCDPREQVTVPDLAPSLASMVMTGVVGSMSSANRYSFTHDAETESDEDHDMPDYQRLKDEDYVVREEFSKELFDSLKKQHEKNEGKEGGTPSAGAPGEPGGEGAK